MSLAPDGRASLRVALNARSANLAIMDGPGESLRNLSRALITTNPGHALDLLTDARLRYDLPPAGRVSVRVLRPFPIGNRVLRSVLGADPWYRARVCLTADWRRWSAYLQSAHEPTPALRGTRHVAIVHDLAFMQPAAKRNFDATTRHFLDCWTAENVHRADRLIAVSDWVRDEIGRVYGISAERISVAAHGVDRTRFRPDHDPATVRAVHEQHGIEVPYVVFVGTLQPRKNLGTLVTAFARARAQGLEQRLVLVGRKGWRYEDVAAVIGDRDQDAVQLVGEIASAELPLLLAGASAFVSVALDEGFGMPALEALASGVPVVASNQAGLAQAVGDAGLLVDPMNVDAIAHALLRITQDAALRESLRGRGLARAAECTWDRAARNVWEALELACASS